MLEEKEFELIIQINGKIRDKVKAPINLGEEKAKKLALNQPKIKQFLMEQKPKKIIFIKNRLINIVI